MNREPGDRAPEGMDRMVRRLRAERPQLEGLELDNLKTRIMARVGSRGTKGATLRGRVVVAVLSMALLGTGAGGVIAASGGGGPGASAASAQYKPPKCPKGTHYSRKARKCVANHVKCPKGTHFVRSSGSCQANKPPKCPKGYHFNKKKGLCARNTSHTRRRNSTRQSRSRHHAHSRHPRKASGFTG